MMEDKSLQIPGTVVEVKTTDDRCVVMKIETQEIGYETAAKLMMIKGSLGHFIFSLSEIPVEDTINLPKLKKEKGQKTDSERLRNTLFIYWKQQGIKEDFEVYRKRYMNTIIDNIKSKLN